MPSHPAGHSSPPEKRHVDARQVSHLACLAEFIGDPRAVSEIPPETIPDILGEIERLRALLWAQMVAPGAKGRGEATAAEDTLLKPAEAAQRLGMSRDFLYRNADKLPFTRRLGPRRLRFSSLGIEWKNYR